MPTATNKPTVLELFAAFAAQLPLLTHEDLKFTVDAMRGSASFRRMLQHAREQALAIGLHSGASRPDGRGTAREGRRAILRPALDVPAPRGRLSHAGLSATSWQLAALGSGDPSQSDRAV